MEETINADPGLLGKKYELKGILGEGGFGVVYLAYDKVNKQISALKTFRDEYMANLKAREAFEKEALVWVNLETHPFILHAEWVEHIYGRLFVKMEYIAPNEHGSVNLADYIKEAAGPVDTDTSLTWAIQFCLGMEHANSHGIECHRDIKPANILVTRDGMVKVSDFGLSLAAEIAFASVAVQPSEKAFDLSFLRSGGKHICGTPGYMAPEVFAGERATVRSDIYSFGLVLWQMASGSQTPPFSARYHGDVQRYAREVYEAQMRNRLEPLDSPFWNVVHRSLQPAAVNRYQRFRDMREDLETILWRRTHKRVTPPAVSKRSYSFWFNKGACLNNLGYSEEAIRCLDKAIETDSMAGLAWREKASALSALNRSKEAIASCDQAIALGADAWSTKGYIFRQLNRQREAIECFDQAILRDPTSLSAWVTKAAAFHDLGCHSDVIYCADRALAIDPKIPEALNNKAISLNALGRYDDAISCYEKAIAVNPVDAPAWHNMAHALRKVKRTKEALECATHAVTIDPQYFHAWHNRAEILHELCLDEESLKSYDTALQINPNYANGWHDKGTVLSRLRRYAEALQCFDKAIQINPEHRLAWRNRGIVLNAAGRPREAIKSFEKAVELSRDASAYQNKALAEALLKDWRAEIMTWESFLRAFSDDASHRDSIQKAKVRLNELRNGWRAKAAKLFWR